MCSLLFPASGFAALRVDGKEVADELRPTNPSESSGIELKDRIMWGHRSMNSPAVSEWKEIQFKILTTP